jgi:NADPH:quinone reductase-like Zn-dependent oxidoreductase
MPYILARRRNASFAPSRTVAAAPGDEFAPGQMVATVMGGMGRAFDGSYAEFTCMPAGQVRALRSALPWAQLGALPEMLQTAWGCAEPRPSPAAQ